MNLEQIAFRIAEEVFGPSPRKFHAPLDEECANFARRLVAALGAQEPSEWKTVKGVHTAYVYDKRSAAAAEREGWKVKPLYAAPPICPTCTQMIDGAARQGRIVDDRRVSDATTKAAERWETIETLWFLSGEPLELGTDDYGNAKVVFDGAECVGEVWVGNDLGSAIDRATDQLAAAPEYKPLPAASSEAMMVPKEILDRFPEINPSNYDHDDVCALNAWGVEVMLAAEGR